jgi:sporulation protein YunB
MLKSYFQHILIWVIGVRFRRFKRQRNSAIFGIFCVVISMLISVLLLDAKLRPAIYDIATVEAKSAAEKKVNLAVEKILLNSKLDYSDIVAVNYSADNQITGITTDIVKMNLFKSEIAKAVDKAFDNSNYTVISVPLGSATGLTLLSGTGPYVEVKIGMSGATKSDFENIFEAAGVNQTQHSVMLNLDTTVILSVTGKRITYNVKTSFCVAQTVIVGSVPNVTLNK